MDDLNVKECLGNKLTIGAIFADESGCVRHTEWACPKCKSMTLQGVITTGHTIAGRECSIQCPVCNFASFAGPTWEIAIEKWEEIAEYKVRYDK